MSLAAFIAALPKVELHLHLEGSITPECALRVAERHGMKLPGAERGAAGLRDAYVFRSFRDFIGLYIAVSRCLMTQDDLVTVIVDLASRLRDQGVRYAEVTFTPLTHRVRGIGADVLWSGLLEGRARAASEYGVVLRWVFDVVRSFPEQAQGTVDFAIGMNARDEGSVVGLGVGGPEGDHYPMDAIVEAFDRGRDLGFKSLPHAGENAGPSSIWTAIRRLHADRIGHGVRCLEDPELVEHLREHQIPLEVCPSSNVALGVFATLAEHPLPRLLQAGLAVSLASDDPPMFGTTLVQEYERSAAAFGWSAAQVRAIAEAGVRHSFAPESLKAELLAAQARTADPADP